MPELVVVIPTHSQRELLKLAIAACGPWPVVVVDDSSAGMAPLDGVRWMRGPGNGGFARAVNVGLQVAAGMGARAALVLNDDAVPAPECIQRLLEVWTRRGGAVGPVIENGLGQVTSAGIELSVWGRLREQNQVREPDVHAVGALSGACLLVGTTWRFDPDFRHGMEDIALCRRIRAAGGHAWLVPDARCRHVGGATVDRTSPDAQRAAVAGHLRLVDGGIRTPVVLGLSVAQVMRDGPSPERLQAVLQGWRDWRAAEELGGVARRCR